MELGAAPVVQGVYSRRSASASRLAHRTIERRLPRLRDPANPAGAASVPAPLPFAVVDQEALRLGIVHELIDGAVQYRLDGAREPVRAGSWRGVASGDHPGRQARRQTRLVERL